MENEDVVDLSTYYPRRLRYGAIIFSVAWNLIILFCLLIITRQQHNITFNVQQNPLVTFQDPLLPPLANMPSAQQQQQPSAAQPVPQTLQQIARQQPLDLSAPTPADLNYLVQQLISNGSNSSGAVVTAVSDVPSTAETLPTKPQSETPQPQESAEETVTDSESETNPEMTNANDDDQEQRETEKTITQPALLQETVEALATTVPPQSTSYTQDSFAQQRPQAYQAPSPMQHVQPHPTATSSRTSGRRKVTLSDLANSFMKQVRNDRELTYNYDPQKKGSSAPGVYSPANSACDGKQLALQMYASKVFMLMQQAAHTLSSLIYAQNDFTTNSLLEITIDYDGSLLRARLNPPIDEKDIEHAVQTIVQRVGLFPPIPKHFNTDTITLTFPLNIQGSKGFGRYSLSYSTNGRP